MGGVRLHIAHALAGVMKVVVHREIIPAVGGGDRKVKLHV